MRRTSKINNSHLHFAKIDKSAQTTAAWLGSIGVHLIIIDCYWWWLFICSVPCCLLNPFFRSICCSSHEWKYRKRNWGHARLGLGQQNKDWG